MKNKYVLSCLLSALLVIQFVPVHVQAAESFNYYEKKDCVSPEIVKLQGELRKLWIDHTIWTRSYIVSALAGLGDQKDVLARLLRNQQDIGNAFKPYYGNAAGDKLAELLRDHILIAGKIVDTAKNNNAADLKKLNAEWHQNADDIAKFLSGINPIWPEKDLQNLLYLHLQFISDQLNARIKKDWQADIDAYDKGENHILLLADTLASGITKQFPERFKQG